MAGVPEDEVGSALAGTSDTASGGGIAGALKSLKDTVVHAAGAGPISP